MFGTGNAGNMAMSEASGKKKITQNDLRRIMNEQKRKFSDTVKKIESPLAKYPFYHSVFRLCVQLFYRYM